MLPNVVETGTDITSAPQFVTGTFAGNGSKYVIISNAIGYENIIIVFAGLLTGHTTGNEVYSLDSVSKVVTGTLEGDSSEFDAQGNWNPNNGQIEILMIQPRDQLVFNEYNSYRYIAWNNSGGA